MGYDLTPGELNLITRQRKISLTYVRYNVQGRTH